MLERADEQVGPGPCRSRAGRAASEVLLVDADHGVGELELAAVGLRRPVGRQRRAVRGPVISITHAPLRVGAAKAVLRRPKSTRIGQESTRSVITPLIG